MLVSFTVLHQAHDSTDGRVLACNCCVTVKHVTITNRAPSVQGPCLGALQNLSAGAPNVPETAVGHQRLIEAGIMSALDAANTRSSGATGTSSNATGGAGSGSGSNSSSKGTSLSCHCASILYNLSRNKKVS
jgi:hypothetical protein